MAGIEPGGIARLLKPKNLLYLAVMLLVAAVAAEMLARLYLGQVLQKSPTRKFQFDSYRIYAHRPGFHEGDGRRDWIVINDQGFRRTTGVTKHKAEKTFRAFFMGGSAAHGISSAAPFPMRHIYPEETIDAVLEKMLEQKYPGYTFEIINAAVTGYQVHQHTAYILSELLDYSPDAVIFFDGYNDHFTVNTAYNLYGDNSYQFWKPRLQQPGFGGLCDYAALWMSRWSALARGYYAWEKTRDANSRDGGMSEIQGVNDDSALIKAHKRAASRQFLRSVEVNLLILQRFGVDSVVCLQPGLPLRHKELLSEQERSFAQIVPGTLKKVLYPTVVDELSTLTGRYGMPFIDMIPCFNDPALIGQQLFIDYCHLTPEGSRVAARAMFPAVEALFLKRLVPGVQRSAKPDGR